MAEATVDARLKEGLYGASQVGVRGAKTDGAGTTYRAPQRFQRLASFRGVSGLEVVVDANAQDRLRAVDFFGREGVAEAVFVGAEIGVQTFEL